MSLKEVQHRVQEKKRRRRRFRWRLLLVVLLAAGVGTLLRAPYFNIQEVEVTGLKKIPSAYVEAEIQGTKGQNFFLFTSRAFQEGLQQQEYFDHLTVRRHLPNRIHVHVVERVAEVNYLKDGVVSLLTRDGVLLEVGANRLPEGLNVIDQVPLRALGENLYEDHEEKIRFLEEYRQLQLRNQSAVSLDTVDLRDMVDIKVPVGELEIRLGRRLDLMEKLNQAISIIEGGNLQGESGYVDVSLYPASPVVFIESLQEELRPPEEEGETAEEEGEESP